MTRMTYTFSRQTTFTATLATLSLGMVLLLAGCGGGSSDKGGRARIPTSGKVDVDGQPAPAGIVTVLKPEAGNTVICQIDDGYYESPSGEGAATGNNLVLVEIWESPEGPAKYAAWKKEVQVGDADFTEDFALNSSELQPADPSSRVAEDGL